MGRLGTAWRSTTGRGRAVTVLGLALLFAGVAWHYPLTLALGGCLLVLVFVELVCVLASRPVTAERAIAPLVVRRHEACHGTLAVTGRRRRGLLRVDVADRVDGALVPVRLPDHTGADAAPVEAGYTVPTPRRGLVDVGPVLVRVAGLTGMAVRSSDSGGVDRVRVLPRQVPIGDLPAGRRRAVAGGADSIDVGGTDLVGLHQYAPGDDLRRLHWATSARTGTLMVRDDAEPAEPHLTVVLDDRATTYPDPDLFEEAVEMAAALAGEAIGRGHPARLLTASGRHQVTVPGSASRRPRPEQEDLDWLLAELALHRPDDEPGNGGPADGRDADVAVAVSGPGADLRELALGLGSAPTRILVVVDPAPMVGVSQETGLMVVRGATSTALAALWDEAVTVR